MYVSSVIENNEILPALKANGEPNGVLELSNWIEEADSQVIIHVNHAVREHKCKCIVVLSNDTNTYFFSCGVNEIWLQYETGEQERMLPIHEISTSMGPAESKVIIKAHILTGEDVMNKVLSIDIYIYGTKYAAIACDPARYLANFGETPIYQKKTLG